MSAGETQNRKQRRYSPTVERLEAVRLLSSATQAHPLASLAAEHDVLTDPTGAVPHLADGSHAVSSATWDAALVQTELADILGPAARFGCDRDISRHRDFAQDRFRSDRDDRHPGPDVRTDSVEQVSQSGLVSGGHLPSASR